MKVYSKEFFLGRILECNENELEEAKKQKFEVCEEFLIPKKDGYRSIVSINKDCYLRKLQNNLQKNFLSRLPISTAAKGFVKKTSYVDFLEEHIGNNFFLRLDIKDFFDSITDNMVMDSIQGFVDRQIAEEIVGLCTWNGRTPQGFITSPTISNIVFRRIDQRIRKYCRTYYKEMKRSISYTRYADDMLFSAVGFDFKLNKNFKRMIVHILRENGFTCNERKTIYTNKEISLSGYVIKEDVHLSRKKMRNLNEVIYQFDDRMEYGQRQFLLKQEKIDLNKIISSLNQKGMVRADGTSLTFNDAFSLIHYMAGWRSYLIQISRVEHGNTGYDRQIEKKIKIIEMILDYLSETEE